MFQPSTLPTQVVNYYYTLGVAESANLDEIKRAYHKKAREWHPDKNKVNSAEAEEKFKLVVEAYSVLSDPVKRSAYDADVNQRNATIISAFHGFAYYVPPVIYQASVSPNISYPLFYEAARNDSPVDESCVDCDGSSKCSNCKSSTSFSDYQHITPKYRNKFRNEGNCKLRKGNTVYPSSRATEI